MTRQQLVNAMQAAQRQVIGADLAAALAGPSGQDAAGTRHPGLDRREGDRAGRRAHAGRRRVHQPPRQADEAAIGPDDRLRHRRREGHPRAAGSAQNRDREADPLQHLCHRGLAAERHRQSRPRRPRGGGQSVAHQGPLLRRRRLRRPRLRRDLRPAPAERHALAPGREDRAAGDARRPVDRADPAVPESRSDAAVPALRRVRPPLHRTISQRPGQSRARRRGRPAGRGRGVRRERGHAARPAAQQDLRPELPQDGAGARASHSQRPPLVPGGRAHYGRAAFSDAQDALHGDREHDGLRPRGRGHRALPMGLGDQDRERPRPGGAGARAVGLRRDRRGGALAGSQGLHPRPGAARPALSRGPRPPRRCASTATSCRRCSRRSANSSCPRQVSPVSLDGLLAVRGVVEVDEDAADPSQRCCAGRRAARRHRAR